MQGVFRPCEVADRDHELVDFGDARRDPSQGCYEVERVLEIRRAFADGLRVSQIRGRRHGLGSCDPWLDFGEVILRQPGQAFGTAGAPPKQVGQYAGLSRRHAHPLSIAWIESAEGIADRDQSLREVDNGF